MLVCVRVCLFAFATGQQTVGVRCLFAVLADADLVNVMRDDAAA